ncbi:MAG: sigma-70 family RNA polymerase sigma factor [Xenococcaceae cyanobacterium]
MSQSIPVYWSEICGMGVTADLSTSSPIELAKARRSQQSERNVEIKNSQKSVYLDKLSNYDLILRCQEGMQPDRAAFAELLRRYQSHVEKLLYHLAPDWSERADLAQEVWIRVYRNIKRLNEPVKFRGWLSRITTNLFYDELRKRKKIAEPLSLDAPRRMDDGELGWEIVSESPSPDDDLSSREFYEQLQSAIAELPQAFRTTIVLREIEGMAYEEIAEITGVSLGTVKSRIARARLKLQSVLQNYLDQ